MKKLIVASTDNALGITVPHEWEDPKDYSVILTLSETWDRDSVEKSVELLLSWLGRTAE